MHYATGRKLLFKLDVPNRHKTIFNAFKGPYENITFYIQTQNMFSKKDQQINFLFMSAPCGYLVNLYVMTGKNPDFNKYRMNWKIKRPSSLKCAG